MRKASLFVFVASMSFGTLAAAQPVAAPCPCPMAFQGFHLGGNVGYGVGSSAVTHNNPAGSLITSTDLGVKGFDGGLNVGYTHRFGNWGLGLEGVFSWASTKGINNIHFGLGTINEKARLNNSIQLRGNISYIICNLMAPKIILGWDNSEWARTISPAASGSPGPIVAMRDPIDKRRYNGFLWGVGVDFLLTKNLIAGFEYTGVIAGKKSFNIALPRFRETTSFRPQYNKFALVVKFIY